MVLGASEETCSWLSEPSMSESSGTFTVVAAAPSVVDSMREKKNSTANPQCFTFLARNAYHIHIWDQYLYTFLTAENQINMYTYVRYPRWWWRAPWWWSPADPPRDSRTVSARARSLNAARCGCCSGPPLPESHYDRSNSVHQARHIMHVDRQCTQDARTFR